MNIAINARYLSRPFTGVERYAHEIYLKLGHDVRQVRPGHLARGVLGHMWEQFILPKELGSDEILWSPANTGPFSIRNQILTLHDLSTLEHPEWYSPSFSWWYRFFIPRLVSLVRRVVVSSETVRLKMIARFPQSKHKLVTIPGGVDTLRFHPNNSRAKEFPGQYILFVGTRQPRKNLGVLLQAWEMISLHDPDLFLVIAGGQSNVFQQTVKISGFDRVVATGYVPDSKLPEMYAGAMAFIMPSLDEGFGLAALEAMACGTPVIAACAGALPETIGEAGLLFNPLNPRDLAQNIETCLIDRTLRQSLIEKGLQRANHFSWQNSAEKLLKVFESCQ